MLDIRPHLVVKIVYTSGISLKRVYRSLGAIITHSYTKMLGVVYIVWYVTMEINCHSATAITCVPTCTCIMPQKIQLCSNQRSQRVTAQPLYTLWSSHLFYALLPNLVL